MSRYPSYQPYDQRQRHASYYGQQPSYSYIDDYDRPPSYASYNYSDPALYHPYHPTAMPYQNTRQTHASRQPPQPIKRSKSSHRHEEPQYTSTSYSPSDRPPPQRPYSISDIPLTHEPHPPPPPISVYERTNENAHEDEESIDENELEAQQNAEKNKTIHRMIDPPDSQQPNFATTSSDPRQHDGIALPMGGEEGRWDQHQNLPHLQQAAYPAHSGSTDFFRNFDPATGEGYEETDVTQGTGPINCKLQGVTSILARARQALSKLKSTHHATPRIQTMVVSAPLGEVIDEHQQKEIMSYLGRPKEPMMPVHDESALRIAKLEFIWVFRPQQAQREPFVWTTFDYQNQSKLAEYEHHPEGLQLLDSHIGQGQIVVHVFPSQGTCYYNLDNHMKSLHIHCIPNSRKIKFVYRFKNENPAVPSTAF
ncbi:hypothetical protein DM01DRAFT_1089899 [Hesseltinella vesiculosa]|uniref:Uncharacterized protein n=1 Tax=Hesseltinella vesiculosa TaxID=101127 RepID=A0A1X2GDS1_9FUNG|nr:hypothetical protein DM01DRAFT_1089899 [Hesseltinella vesiculosa]